MTASLSGTLATMCCGVPYATAAKFCFPDRVAIAFVADGAMQMLGINGLITIAKYWREWADPRLIIVVLNNRVRALAAPRRSRRLRTSPTSHTPDLRRCWISEQSESPAPGRSDRLGRRRCLQTVRSSSTPCGSKRAGSAAACDDGAD
jgi:Thiamine pyrophosphate enzyme, C-terminal TPP binding domain